MALRAALTICSALLLTAALCPAAALGASAAVDKTHDHLAYNAGNGEKNSVSVSVSGGTYTITDPGATISAGTGCTSVNANKVTCVPVPGGPINYVVVRAGDQDDGVTIAGPIPSWTEGASGNDRLTGGADEDWLWGSVGDDHLDGGLGSDLLSGGDGHDIADFSVRTAALTITLDGSGGDGETGENDNVGNSIEEVRSGAGNDTVTGGTAANSLSGGAGNDTLNGGAGDDTVDGGPGQDALEGGDGNDSILSSDGFSDQVSCGIGADTALADPIDTLAPDCEVGDTGATPDTDPSSPLALVPQSLRMSRAGSVRVRIYCPKSFGVRCVGTITLSAVSRKRRGVAASRTRSGKRLGRGKFSVAAGTSESMKVTMSREGRRRVLQRKRVKCRAKAVTRNSNGNRSSATTKVTVKAPKRKRGRS